MSRIVKMERRARHLLVDGAIPIQAVTAAIDEECYACGAALAPTEGKVDVSPHFESPFGLYCDPPCAEREASKS